MATPRLTYCSVTVFLHSGDEYLLLHRLPTKKIDPNRLNGIGGKLEPSEDYLTAAIRETEEETGYKIQASDFHLAGIARLEGGYQQDWIVAFFKVEVRDKKIPVGNHTSDGELLWMDKTAVLQSGYELVDDLKICFPILVQGKEMFFLAAKLNEREKVESYSLQTVPFHA